MGHPAVGAFDPRGSTQIMTGHKALGFRERPADVPVAGQRPIPAL